MFLVCVLCLCFSCRFGVFGDEVKSVSVMEGDSVTLNADDTTIQTNDKIMWRFGPEESLIARVNTAANTVIKYDDVLDGRFRDRLQVDHQSGSLTITDIRTTDSGLYKMTVNSWQKTSYTFSVTVYAHLPVPVITSNCSSSSSSPSCVFVCSVMNVSHVTLSWYKGNSLLSSISASDLISIISIPLFLDCLDDSYSCVINNPISSQTRYLTSDCQTCSDCVSCCYGLQAVIRLVVSVLVGVATVAVLVHDITS